jgi:hypothetical protein
MNLPDREAKLSRTGRITTAIGLLVTPVLSQACLYVAKPQNQYSYPQVIYLMLLISGKKLPSEQYILGGSDGGLLNPHEIAAIERFLPVVRISGNQPLQALFGGRFFRRYHHPMHRFSEFHAKNARRQFADPEAGSFEYAANVIFRVAISSVWLE